MFFVSMSVYAVDTFTAINLLAFNRWAGQISPALDLKYSRWVFAGCIILSFVLLIYRWMRALKVMRGGKVAKAYLDPLAVRVECIRMGEGRGWKRFLLFAELTKSRKGADYVALFAYFSFEAWLRIVFAEGPRQVINAMTLIAYAEANFVPVGEHAAPKGQSPFVQFWKNIGVLAEKDNLQVAIIFGMLWTLLIWLISAISLAVSVILYLIFLWHHIPSDAGGLSGYCRTKINRRMERIVRTKTDKALKKENEIRARQEAKALREGNDSKRQPTLPDMGVSSTPSLTPISRQSTMTTLPEYSSRPGTAVPMEEKMPPMPTPIDTNTRPAPRRHMTAASDASWSSYNSNAPLMHSATDAGYSSADWVQTPASGVSTPWSARPGPQRNFTGSTDFQDRSFTPAPPRPSTAQSYRGASKTYQMEPLPRPGTGMSHRSRPMRQSGDSDMVPPPRGITPVSSAYPHYPLSATSAYAPSLPDPQGRRTPAQNNNLYFPPVSPIPEHGGRESPAFVPPPPSRSHTPIGLPRSVTPGHAPPLPRISTSNPVNNTGYVAFNPNMERTASPASMHIMNEGYRSYSRPVTAMSREHAASSAPISEGYRSFSRPATSTSGRQSPPDINNLEPPLPNGPRRAGSFDYILDHY